MSPQSGIYKITNIENQKFYIGSATNLLFRKRSHFSSLKSGLHKNQKLQRAYNKYGCESFKFEVLLYCDSKNLIMYEQLVIDALDPVKNGFNINPVAGSTVGYKHTEDSKKKMSQAAIDRPKPKPSKETCLKISLSKIGKKRKPFTEEARRNMSLAHLGKKRGPLSEETKQKIAKAKTGKPGWKHTPESIAKIRAYHVGKKRSDVARANMRAGWLRKKQEIENERI